jgi:hypothetical protein
LFLLGHCIPPWSTTLESFRSLRKFSCGRSAFDETLSNHEVHEEHEGFGFFVIANFVLFVSFVVISIVCSLRPARAYRNTPYNYHLFFASFAFFAVKFPFIFVNFVSFVVNFF